MGAQANIPHQEHASDRVLTRDLLEKLLASASPKSYLDSEGLDDRSLPEYLLHLLSEKKLGKADVIKASGLNATFAYQIFQGARKPGRDSAIMLAFGLGCSLAETQRLLRHAGVAELWPKLRRDAIIIFCIEHGMTREETDDELYRFEEPTLLNGEG